MHTHILGVLCRFFFLRVYSEVNLWFENLCTPCCTDVNRVKKNVLYVSKVVACTFTLYARKRTPQESGAIGSNTDFILVQLQYYFLKVEVCDEKCRVPCARMTKVAVFIHLDVVDVFSFTLRLLRGHDRF